MLRTPNHPISPEMGLTPILSIRTEWLKEYDQHTKSIIIHTYIINTETVYLNLSIRKSELN